MQPLDALTVHKHVTNRWMELQGVRTAAYEGADYDAIAHLSPAARDSPGGPARRACGPR